MKMLPMAFVHFEFEYRDHFFSNFDLDSKYCDFSHDLEFRLLTNAFSLTVCSLKHGHVTLTDINHVKKLVYLFTYLFIFLQ